jgi:1-aminocyclopropane-1-carboxylate deaminase
VLDIAQNTADLIGRPAITKDDVVLLEGYAYPVYGVPSQETVEAIRLRGTLGKLDAQDPVVAIETQADNLRQLKVLYIDCGEKDQFNLLYGARRFVRRLNELGVAHR